MEYPIPPQKAPVIQTFQRIMNYFESMDRDNSLKILQIDEREGIDVCVSGDEDEDHPKPNELRIMYSHTIGNCKNVPIDDEIFGGDRSQQPVEHARKLARTVCRFQCEAFHFSNVAQF